MNCSRWQFLLCNDVHNRVYKISFQAPPQKCAYENHKKRSTRGKIYYEIKHNFCVDTLNESCYE